MSKSRRNAIAISASEDETTALVRSARTDAERHVSYEPERRPEVANLVLLAAMCLDEAPGQVAEAVGPGGAEALKATLTDALNDRLRPIRRRRQALAADPGYLREVLARGNEHAGEIAERTLRQVRELMHMVY